MADPGSDHDITYLYKRNIVIIGTAAGASAVATYLEKFKDYYLKESIEIVCKKIPAFSSNLPADHSTHDIKRTFCEELPGNSVNLILLVYDQGVPNSNDADMILKTFSTEAWTTTAIVITNCGQGNKQRIIDSCNTNAKSVIQFVPKRVFAIGSDQSYINDEESLKSVIKDSGEMRLSKDMVVQDASCPCCEWISYGCQIL